MTPSPSGARPWPDAAVTGAYLRPGWWNERERHYASLRAVNGLRLQILGGWLHEWFGANGPATVVDLGCGGGLMAVPLAAQGARVLGCDLSLPAVREAAARGSPRTAFACGNVAAPPVAEGSAELVLLSDVLEHVDEPAVVVAAAARLLRPGGYLFVNTINRTWRARLLAIWCAEGLGVIPRGTHAARRFIKPGELARMARSCGLLPRRWCGERPLLLESLRRGRVAVRQGTSLAIGYCAGFQNGAMPAGTA